MDNIPVKGVAIRMNEIRYTVVLTHYPFGFSGCAGSIDDVAPPPRKNLRNIENSVGFSKNFFGTKFAEIPVSKIIFFG